MDYPHCSRRLITSYFISMHARVLISPVTVATGDSSRRISFGQMRMFNTTFLLLPFQHLESHEYFLLLPYIIQIVIMHISQCPSRSPSFVFNRYQKIELVVGTIFMLSDISSHNVGYDVRLFHQIVISKVFSS